MQKVDIREAKTRLSQLVEVAEAGETVIIARAGKAVAKLVRVGPARVGRVGIELGLLKGRIPEKLVDDIARPLSRKQIERLFGGGLEA